MAYGKIKADTLVYDNGGSDVEKTVASLAASAPTNNPTFTGTINGAALTLSGNLQVNGTTTTVASSTMTVTDKNIEIAKGAANDAAADGAGITVDSGDGDKTWNWVNADDAWTSSEHIKLGDNKKFISGDNNDFQIYHAGNAHKVIGAATGSIHIQAPATEILNVAGTQFQAKFIDHGACELYHSDAKKFETTAAGVTVTGTVSDSKGDLRKLTNNTQSSAYTLVASDAGKYVLMQGSGGNITIPGSVFSAGDMVTIINHTTSNITIVKPTNMFYTADGSNANRTLAGKGMATLIFTDANTCYISGGGLS